jgi:very-short-patch-repair endonuclease
VTSIYLAGKISRHDWREDVAPSIQDAWGNHSYGNADWSAHDAEWPVLPNAVLNAFDYTGPYFVDGCTHSADGCPQEEHRASSMCEGEPSGRAATVQRCLNAIDRSDIVFAWLDDATAHGTLVELGYAKGRGKPVIVAGPNIPRTWDQIWKQEEAAAPALSPAPAADELWFAFTCATSTLTANTPREAIEQISDMFPRLESPIEEAFWSAYLHKAPEELLGLKAQHPVLDGKYRLDFALPGQKIGIELDGYAWHSDRKTFTKDRARQRELELDGWRLIRFSGSEINASPEDCVRQAAALAGRITAT